MSKKSEQIKKWRKNTKARIIEAMGGSCVCCGYSKCHAALALHHIDPSQKDFSLGAIRASIKSWKTIVQELKKCVLLCHNCHSEIHDGMRLLPNNYSTFNSNYENYKDLKEVNNCPICSKPMSNGKKFCSVPCMGKGKQKVNWDSIDLINLVKSKPMIAIAKELGCSDKAVAKRLRKLAKTEG